MQASIGSTRTNAGGRDDNPDGGVEQLEDPLNGRCESD